MFEDEEQVSEETKDLEPQVTSSDPNVRKLARRLRLERRLEAIRKQNLPVEEVAEEAEEKSDVHKQIEESAEKLRKLIIESDEYITNVRVANDYREVDRREAEGLGRQKVIDQLEQEAKDAQDKFEAIAERWTGILKYNDPLHMNDAICDQKSKCDELILQKDSIIAMMRQEIAAAERKYALDQRKQIDDIYILSHRIEKQLTLMRRAYREEFALIEASIAVERKITMENNDKKWDDLYKKRDEQELLNAVKKEEQQAYFDDEMTRLRHRFQEKFRDTKISLENDISTLQKELEEIKALALLNSEKLDYNYQILKKREDENIIIRSQQKRRINKMQDIINIWRRKIVEYEKNTKVQVVKTAEEIKMMHKNIMDIETKADHFANINDRRFNQLWEANGVRAMELVDKILVIDRILYEQQLGLDWSGKDLRKRKQIKKTSLPSYKAALEVIQGAEDDKKEEERSVLSKTVTYESDVSGASKEIKEKKSKSIKSEALSLMVQPSLLNRIMKQISDASGFLIEDRLKVILEPFMDQHTTLVKVDNVFSALNINKRADVDLLMNYFLPFTHCPLCSGPTEEKGEDTSGVNEVTENISISLDTQISKASTADGVSEKDALCLMYPTVYQTTGMVQDIVADMLEGSLTSLFEEKEDESDIGDLLGLAKESFATLRSEDNEVILSKTSVEDSKHICQNNHPLVISSVYILKAIKNFLSANFLQRSGVPGMADRLGFQRKTICRLVTERDIRFYWEQYRKVFDPERESIWNALLHGLQKYHAILKDRASLYDEVVALRKENSELKNLLELSIQEMDMEPPPCAEQRRPVVPPHICSEPKSPPELRARKL